jgi:hypothetical protein
MLPAPNTGVLNTTTNEIIMPSSKALAEISYDPGQDKKSFHRELRTQKLEIKIFFHIAATLIQITDSLF